MKNNTKKENNDILIRLSQKFKDKLKEYIQSL